MTEGAPEVIRELTYALQLLGRHAGKEGKGREGQGRACMACMRQQQKNGRIIRSYEEHANVSLCGRQLAPPSLPLPLPPRHPPSPSRSPPTVPPAHPSHTPSHNSRHLYLTTSPLLLHVHIVSLLLLNPGRLFTIIGYNPSVSKPNWLPTCCHLSVFLC